MNYEKIYKSLIAKRQQLILDKSKQYCEKHHILPKSLDGTDENSNLILLTAREHYIAHRLLSKIMLSKYGNKSQQYIKMICALLKMNDAKHQEFMTSHVYEHIRSEQGRLNKIRFSGKNNPMYGVHRYGKLNPCAGHKWMYNAQLNKFVYPSNNEIKKYLDLGYIFKGHSYTHSEHAKQLNREKHLNKHPSLETRQKMIKNRTGRKILINKLTNERHSARPEEFQFYLMNGYTFVNPN